MSSRKHRSALRLRFGVARCRALRGCGECPTFADAVQASRAHQARNPLATQPRALLGQLGTDALAEHGIVHHAR